LDPGISDSGAGLLLLVPAVEKNQLIVLELAPGALAEVRLPKRKPFIGMRLLLFQ
jgi:hypothetical protein